MVDISSGDKKINITVSTSGNKASVNATPDTAMYYSNKSREWAISDKIVDNEDYSSKYYANVSKKQAEIVKDKIIEVNNAVEEGITNIINQENISVDNVNTAGETQVNLAKEQATIATTQAGIATAKTSEVVESGNNAITAITAQETTSKNNIETKGAEQITLIQNEGATQVANVQSTGFYMRDDKLYFINSQGEETEFKSGGSGLEVCDIGTALYVDETKGLRRYLNGQIVDINANTQAFLDRLKEITTLHPSLLCTEDEWQTAKTMSAFGQVGKFVFNYSGDEVVSVRIPRVVNIQGVFDLQNLGMTVAESLPNIKASMVSRLDKGYNPSGAVYRVREIDYTGNELMNGYEYGFDASRSSSTYQDNAPVQQEAIQYPYFIQIATGAETENNIINTLENVNGFTLLESKYSDKPLYNEGWLLSNGQWNAGGVYVTVYEGLQVEYNTEIEAGTTVTLPSGTSYTKRGLSVKLSTEEYDDYDFVLNTSDETFRLPLLDGSEDLPSDKVESLTLLASGSTYTAPANGYYYLQKAASGTSQYGYLINMQNYMSTGGYNSISSLDYKLFLPAKKNDVIKIEYTLGGATKSFRFIYAQGNGSLYFYVGETVQNANLIDAGRIGEHLATKTDKVQAGRASMPSNRYVDLTLGASGSTYTAPADGWFYFSKISNSQFIALVNQTAGHLTSEARSFANGIYLNIYIPARKGDVVMVDYNANGTTNYFRFIYAVGSEGEV